MKSPPDNGTYQDRIAVRTSRHQRISTRYMRDRWKDFLSQDKRGMLMIEGVPVDQIVAKYGTPLYVMVESEIRRRARRFKKVFSPPVPARSGNRSDGKTNGRACPEISLQYAAKVNSNLEILRILREEGFDLDCSSVGEIILGLLADFKPKQLTFTNLHKTPQDLHFAAQMGVQSITADSIEEIEHIAATARKLKKHIDTVIRVNPMLQVGNYSTRGNKYGVPIGYIDRAIDLARKSPYVDFQGFHFHGGYVHNPRVYKAAARVFVKLIKRCQDRGIRIKSLSLGGGFPAAIGGEHAFPIENMKDFPRYFHKLCERTGTQPFRLIFEPGKALTLNAGIGLMRVISKKRLGVRHRMVIADGSTYNFVPDFFSILQEGITYDMLPASQMNSRRVHKVTIAGSTCDCWDLISKNLEMPKLRAGDLLAAMDVGAYAQVMASNFNTIKRAAVVLISPDGTMKIIRRRDRYSEMFAPELDVLKVAEPNELEKYNNLYRVNIDKIWRGSQAKKNGNGSSAAHAAGGNGNRNGSALLKSMKKMESVMVSSVEP